MQRNRSEVWSRRESLSPLPEHSCCGSVTKSCPTLCNPLDSSMPGCPILHYLWEFAPQSLLLIESWGLVLLRGLPLWLSWERIRLQCRRPRFDPWVGKIPWRKDQLPTPMFWPGEFHELCKSMGSQSIGHN